jgi:uncharacterized membrane protein YtjA (UPF0391 family)
VYWLAVLFAILTVIFGIWAFTATTVWAGAQVLFWICLVLFILSLIGGAWRPAPPTRPLP